MTPEIDVTSVTAAVAEGAQTVASITRAAIARIHEAEALNAFTSIDPLAGERAADLDTALARGDALGPLAGVPIAVKDLIDHAGRPNTHGSSFEPTVPQRSAPVIERLERAGAVVVGRTGLHEFAFGFSSENHWFGPVRNPWDHSLSPGGSSGGSAAAVAAGIVPVALGTDTGGSVRVPAALCGVVGLKVTHGRVPIRGVYPLAPSLDTVGPFGRSVEDVAAVFRVIAGDDPADPWSVPLPLGAPTDPQSRQPAHPTIGIPHPWVDTALSEPIDAGWRWAIEQLGAAGFEIVDIDAPLLEPPGEIAASVNFEAAAIHRSRFAAQPEAYGPEVAERLDVAMRVTGEQYLEALAWRAACRHAADRAFDRCDALMTPAVATAHKTIGRDDVDLSGTTSHYRPALSHFSALVNNTGLPAIALPLDIAGAPPPSIQLIGPAFEEELLLDLGGMLERLGIVAVRTPPSFFR